MNFWRIQEISNGFILMLPNGKETFYDSWEDVLKALQR